MDLQRLAETVEIKIKLKKIVDGKEYIQYYPLTRNHEPVLFDDLVKAVENSMNRQYESLQKDIDRIVKSKEKQTDSKLRKIANSIAKKLNGL